MTRRQNQGKDITVGDFWKGIGAIVVTIVISLVGASWHLSSTLTHVQDDVDGIKKDVTDLKTDTREIKQTLGDLRVGQARIETAILKTQENVVQLNSKLTH